MLEMDEDAPEIFVVLLDTVIQGADVLLVEEAQHALFELTAAFAGDDLDQRYFLLDGLVHDALQLGFDFIALVVNIMQIEFQFCHCDNFLV
jgi:hypothetical protein